ncbi:MAG: cytochrome b/b6 domain-containing protein [Chloroflexota bacterium]
MIQALRKAIGMQTAVQQHSQRLPVTRRRFSASYLLLAGGTALLATALAVGAALAQPKTNAPGQAITLHPAFALLDAEGSNVLDTGRPVSTMNTCGQCHDTAYIATHSFHSDLGQSDFATPGKWNPLTYRYLLPDENLPAGLRTGEWVSANAARLVGGGPAEAVGLEMNCFSCHLEAPDNAARVAALRAGNFALANTASLAGTGWIEVAGDTYTWNRAAFSQDGKLRPEFVTIQDPTNANCAQCHGAVQTSSEPLRLTGCELDEWQTATTGQIISPDKIAGSGMNLANKNSLTRSFDIHAERGLQCTDCHYALNNPAYSQASSNLSHLQFDPRRLEIAEYLRRPNHNFARGQSAQNTIAPELKGTMRRCESCHDAQNAHPWLPYAERHLDELACESCHTPQLYAPAVQSYDWTVLTAGGEPVSTCRGVEENESETSSGALNDLVTGFAPVLLPRQNVDGKVLLAPYNLITAWYWVDAAGNPLSRETLQAAWFENGAVAPQILAALDTNQNGTLEENELLLDTGPKQTAVAERLAALGVANPHIAGEIQPYSVNHNVTGGAWAIRDCTACHADESSITRAMKLADSLPGGVTPAFVSDSNTLANGSVYRENGALYYRPATQNGGLYIFGHDRVPWVDWVGGLFFVGVLGGVAVHGGLRFYAAWKAPRHRLEFKRVYMYAAYERFWHWLQTFAIVLLLFTGLIIHRPDMFGVFSFSSVVLVHNVLAALLVINAALSLFYHLVSGEIRQYIPRPYGFFDEAILQARYYLQGIFKRAPHPFEKTPQKKLNPLQQATYFGILNVLLPLQVVTGALMWGVQQWPQVAGWFGGLPFLAPFHSLIAWTFAAFIVGHVYLTTTGPQPLTSLKAMVNGWEDVEVHPFEEEPGETESDASKAKAAPEAS